MTNNPAGFNSRLDPWVILLSVFSLLNFGRIWWLHDPIWDDNCWLQNIYATSSLQEFLALGFVELRRVLLGTALYALFSFHESGQYFYVVWHGLDTVTEVASPILLYLLVRNLFGRDRPLAFFIALSFIAFRLDHTLGYPSAINYRIGLLLSLLSFYLTERGLTTGMPRAAYMFGAILATGVAAFVFTEPTVTVEPARLLLIGYLLRRHFADFKALMRRAAVIWSPFVLLGVLLVAHKILDKPFGLYQGAYTSPHALLQAIKIPVSIVYWEAVELFDALQYRSPWSFILSLLAALMAFVVLCRLVQLKDTDSSVAGYRSCINKIMTHVRSEKAVLWLGLTFLLCPVPAFLFADRSLGGNMNSSHATILQIGLAILLGVVLNGCHTAVSHRNTSAKYLGIGLLAFMLAFGTFVNNKYLDLFFQSWEEQARFWQLFTQRFPNLPHDSAFFFDVNEGARFSDLRIYYDFEFHLNLLYAASRRPEVFHRRHAYTIDELRHGPPLKMQPDDVIERETHFGKEILPAKKFIVVRYRAGELLVNREIVKRYPEVEYREWVDKDFPALPALHPYPLREKLEQPG